MTDKEQFLKSFVQIMKDNEGTLSDGFKWYVDHGVPDQIEQNLMRIGSLVWDSLEDQKRMSWLAENSRFVLGGYISESGHFSDASKSNWILETNAVFDGLNSPPKDVREAISIAMNS